MIAIRGIPLVAPVKRRRYKRTTEHNVNYGTGVRAEVTKIIWMRSAGKTLAEIGEEFGVSREWVRQLLKQNGITGYVNLKPEPPPRIINFKVVMLRWLQWAGFGFCSACRLVKTCGEFSPKSLGRMCKGCNAAHSRKLYATNPEHRERQKAYNKTAARRGYFREYGKRPEVVERKKSRKAAIARGPVT